LEPLGRESRAPKKTPPMRSNRRTFLALACLPVFTACAAPGGSSARVPRHDAHTFYASTSFAGASFSHDGKTLLVTSDQSGIFNAYALDIASGALRPLTHST